MIAQLSERITELEMRESARPLPSSIAPPGMSHLRPGYRSPSELKRMASEKLAEMHRRDKPERADPNHA